MSLWSLIVPETSINLVKNPSVEEATTGFTAIGGAISRVTLDHFRGAYALEIAPTSGGNDGAYYDDEISLTSGLPYTFSLDIKANSGVPLRIYFSSTADAILGTPCEFTATGEWQRVSVTYEEISTNTRRVHVEKNGSASIGYIYIDGLQVIQADHDVTYVDGDQPGCEWYGGEHSSLSRRLAKFRSGGRVYDLDTYNYSVDETPGIGMPELSPIIEKKLQGSGNLYRGWKVHPRVFELIGNQRGDSRVDLHSNRKALIDVIKPDLTPSLQSFLLQYIGANSNKAAQIACVYDTGLGFQRPPGFNETMPMRLIAFEDPFWSEEGDQAIHLTTKKSIANANSIVAKIDSQWQALGSGLTGGTGIVKRIAKGPDGSIYAVGSFTTSGATAVSKIAKWNGSAWVALGDGFNSTVNTIAIGPDGSVYVGGAFTASGAATIYRLAKWNGSAWSQVGDGLDGNVYILKFGVDGKLYIGGTFTDVEGGGGGTYNYIAAWDGAAFSALGTGMDGAVYALEISSDGFVYAGGVFTTAGGSSIQKIAKWDGSAWSALGDGLNNDVKTLKLSSLGILYAGGAFTDTYGGPGGTYNYIAAWDGESWNPLSSGVSGASQGVYAIDIDAAGLVYVAGAFTQAGDISAVDRIAIWNGFTWVPIDIDLPGSPYVYSLLVDGENIYIGYNTAGTAIASFVNSVNNGGSESAYPKIVLRRSGGTSATIVWIKNESTGEMLWFDYSLADGEKLIIDTNPSMKKCESSLFGSAWRAILRGSQIGAFHFAPGANNISVYINDSGAPTLTAYFLWKNKHWSADGVAI